MDEKTEQGRVGEKHFHFLYSFHVARNERQIPSDLQPIRNKIKVEIADKNLTLSREIVLKSPIITPKFECTFKGSKTLKKKKM